MQISSTFFTYWLNWSIRGQFLFALYRDTKLSMQKSCLFLQGFFRGYKLPVNWKAHRCDCVVFKAFSSIQQEGQREQLLADKIAQVPSSLQGFAGFYIQDPLFPTSAGLYAYASNTCLETVLPCCCIILPSMSVSTWLKMWGCRVDGWAGATVFCFFFSGSLDRVIYSYSPYWINTKHQLNVEV